MTNKGIIQPGKFYSATHVVRNEFFPWIKSVMTLTAMLDTEKGRDVFKPIVRVGEKGDRRFFIKGSNIIEVNKLAEQGLLDL